MRTEDEKKDGEALLFLEKQVVPVVNARPANSLQPFPLTIKKHPSH